MRAAHLLLDKLSVSSDARFDFSLVGESHRARMRKIFGV
jgi:hypothetical protein